MRYELTVTEYTPNPNFKLESRGPRPSYSQEFSEEESREFNTRVLNVSLTPEQFEDVKIAVIKNWTLDV